MQYSVTAPDNGARPLRELFQLCSFSLLAIHLFCYCFPFLRQLGLSVDIALRIARNLMRMAIFNNYFAIKTLVLVTLGFSLAGRKPAPGRQPRPGPALYLLCLGTFVFFFSAEVMRAQFTLSTCYVAYLILTLSGFLLTWYSLAQLSMLIFERFSMHQVFNTQNEAFPQEEKLIENEYSVNLPASYDFRGRKRPSWVNIINPFRGLLILGTPGSGKTFFIVRHIIRQHIQKGFAMFIYDFKYPDLSRVAYKYWLERCRATAARGGKAVGAAFFVINFDNPMHRCNPIFPDSMRDITDAAESARTILLGLNHEWIKKQGDFWVESAINFLTAIIWYLRTYDGGRYCSLAHVIELAQVPYEKLFSILRVEPQVESLIMPFVTAFMNEASAQLEGQVAGTTVSLGKLSSPGLYYVLSGSDFTLDINNPLQPKIVCAANNPQKAGIYGAMLSLYVTSLTRQLNRRNMVKCSLVFDEFPSVHFNGIDHLMATARSNKVATTLVVQDASQLKLHYGREQAEVIINIVGNIISGQVSGETARQLAERFGKIIQERQSVSVHEGRTSVTNSTQLDMAIPPST
ncbi:MAG TPA: YWFCY domain-containing protein, partial [Puia sp.]|nr:YWFCY domain-containing protein [Puia sp.]